MFRRRKNGEQPTMRGDYTTPPSNSAATLTARDLMTRKVPTVREDTRLAGVAAVMLEHSVGCALVLGADDRLRGTITEADFALTEGHAPFSQERYLKLFGEPVAISALSTAYTRGRWLTAAEVMHPPACTVSPETPMADVVRLMLRRHVEYVPVIADSRVVGMISRRDLLRLVAGGDIGGVEGSDLGGA
jgi:CBS domain-containing protein